jgi:hypothetical protein
MDDAVTAKSLEDKGWTLDQALDNFVAEVHEPIRQAGKTPVVWQEMVRYCETRDNIRPNLLMHRPSRAGACLH